jgi:hypothetical protein
MITDYETKLGAFKNEITGCDKDTFDDIKCKEYIKSKMMFEMTDEFRNYIKTNSKINETYRKLSDEILRYNMNNKKLTNDPKSYERIDNDGNLFKDINRTLTDGRIDDNKEIQINHNTSHIVFSLVISSIMLISIALY